MLRSQALALKTFDDLYEKARLNKDSGARQFHLNLQSQFLGPKGVEAIASKLAKYQAVTHLNLRANFPGKEGTQALALTLMKDQYIIELDLTHNQLDVTCMQFLALAFKTNQIVATLKLCANNLNQLSAEVLAAALKVNHGIKHLDLTECDINDAGAKAIAEAVEINQFIIDLLLHKNNIGPKGAKALGKALMVNHSIRQLDLIGNHIGQDTTDGVSALAEALKVNQTLKCLRLCLNKLGNNGMHALAEGLIINRSITELSLFQNDIEAQGAIAIAKVLTYNRGLKYLELSFNKLFCKGAIALAEGLKTNRYLITLDLCNNRIENEGAKAIANTLAVNRSLKTLILSGNEITTEGIIAIATALKTNPTLTTLKLETTQMISAEGIDALIDAFKFNKTITNIVVRDDDAKTFKSKLEPYLVRNEILTKLNAVSERLMLNVLNQSPDSLPSESDITDHADYFDLELIHKTLVNTFNEITHFSKLNKNADLNNELFNEWHACVSKFHLRCIDHPNDESSIINIHPMVARAEAALKQINEHANARAEVCFQLGRYYLYRASTYQENGNHKKAPAFLDKAFVYLAECLKFHRFKEREALEHEKSTFAKVLLDWCAKAHRQKKDLDQSIATAILDWCTDSATTNADTEDAVLQIIVNRILETINFTLPKGKTDQDQLGIDKNTLSALERTNNQAILVATAAKLRRQKQLSWEDLHRHLENLNILFTTMEKDLNHKIWPTPCLSLFCQPPYTKKRISLGAIRCAINDALNDHTNTPYLAMQLATLKGTFIETELKQYIATQKPNNETFLDNLINSLSPTPSATLAVSSKDKTPPLSIRGQVFK